MYNKYMISIYYSILHVINNYIYYVNIITFVPANLGQSNFYTQIE